MKKITKEMKIGMTAIVAIVILFFGMNFLKGFIVLSNDVQYTLTFTQIEGLSSSCPLYANGFKVGVVRNIDYDYENNSGIKVTADVDKNLRIPKGSKAEISSDLMGNVRVNIQLADVANGIIEPGGIIEGYINGGAMAQVAKLVPVVEQMLPKLDSILASVNTLLADPAVANSLHNVEALTSDLRTSTTELNKMLGTVNGQLPSMLATTNATLSNAEQLTGKLAQVDVAATMQQVNATLANVNAFTAQLNSKEGSFGKFMHDPTIYDNMASVMQHADSLVVDLKAHPKRYVHFSVFGRKDK